MREHRRPNLATIVGSGLAAVAAGSLLAFSSLAEQAGLQGLASAGLQPAAPLRGGGPRAIRLPAPAPAEPIDPIEQIVRDSIARATAPVTSAPPTPRVTPGAPSDDGPGRPAKKDKPRHHHRRPERPEPVVTVAAKETVDEEPAAAEGPPYGNAYGHDKHDKKAKAPKPPKHVGKKKSHSDEGPAEPMYARSRNDEDESPSSKPPKLQKVKKAGKPEKDKGDAPAGGKGNGHSKHAHDNGKGGDKGKGHSKHGN